MDNSSANTTLEKYPQQIGVGTCIISERARRYVNDVLDSARLTYGPFSQAFEKKFAEAHNCKFAVLMNSGTSALRVSIAALKEKHGWQDGDEILIPAITFICDVNVITSNGLTPVFVDVDPLRFSMDPALVASKLTSRSRAIMPTHLCGLPANMEALMKLACERDLRVIEDACEAAFARYNDKPVGSFGDIGCYSTYQAHIVATGVGGLALTNDPETAVLLRSLANHGRDGIYIQIDDDKGKTKQELEQIVSKRFTFIRPGFSFRVTELEAAIGLAQLEDGMEPDLLRRQQNAAALTKRLERHASILQLPTVPADSSHVFMMYPLVVRPGSGVSRDELVNFLEEYNIETRKLLPILDQPFIIKRYGDLAARYPVADSLNKGAFYIGSHSGIGEEEIEYIGKVFDIFFASRKLATT